MNTREDPFINNEMQPDESLVWVGQPDAGLALKVGIPLTIIALIIGLCVLHDLPAHCQQFIERGQWTIFAVFDFFELLFVIPLVPLALAPLWLYQKARQTYYAVSTKRILVFNRGSKRSVASYERESLTPFAQVKLFGKLHLLWNAPGFYRDSDGDYRRNTVLFAALPPESIYKIGIEFPTITSARQLPPQ
ncbi:MAG: hypothetical protein IPP57_18590 [Candidatus Obscuribacter sp.]|jgi:hypothetical protein|nr:hypothetical protein [Candidatus Obscuribacter sp.]MDQ5963912.1 hypothetical protein [Cyanobacteriota bacterium erpe_2018_sw_39hr_WHONDRS-SW48-000098_B_bin.30]MBK9772796.1 hypothetical protein [Candidatus Obscuribacter sp.]MBL0188844.1 hypothetical protein [Candidatus Obscuribacter sp.]MBP6350368.1 hypothetical protein [Candidatus Obscuribacter sp.]